MGTLTQLLIAALSVSGVVGLLAMSVVVVRLARLGLGRRRARLAGRFRPVLLSLATGETAGEETGEAGEAGAAGAAGAAGEAGEGGEGGNAADRWGRPGRDLERLAGVNRRIWKAVEPALLSLVAKLRGSSQTLLLEVLRRRGAYDDALRQASAWRAVRRAGGAERLGLLGDPEATPVVVGLLADRDPQVRRVAARAASRLPSEAAARSLLETLDGPRPVSARVVTQALLRMGQPAVPALVAMAAEERPAVAAVAVEVLGLLRNVPSAPVLLEALRQGPPEVQVRAARALGRIGNPAAVDALIEATSAGRPRELRVVALGALGAIGDGRRAAELAGLLADADPKVATAAGRALGSLGGAGEETLRQAAASGGPGARYARVAVASVELVSRRGAQRGRAS